MTRGRSGDRSDSPTPTVLSAVGKEYSAAILCAAATPKSAGRLSDDVGIPIATCYRRIEELVDVGLLTCAGRRLSEAGRQTTVYRRPVDELEVEFSLEGPTCSREQRSEARASRNGGWEYGFESRSYSNN